MTRLAVAITVQSHEQALADAAQAGEFGADLVEYRVDQFTDLEDVAFLVKRSPLPCIVTCRPVWEGGACELTDQERVPVLEAASLAGASYVDIELVAYRRSANLRQKVHFNAGTPGGGAPGRDQTAPRPDRQGLIVSSHDFEGRPARLTNLVAELNTTGADVAKIVWTARSVRDNLEAFELLRAQKTAQGGKPTIALCMGEAGLISRLLAPKFGGFLTFAALARESVTAPGQPTLKDLLEVYRFRSIKPATAVYGVVGHPVSHSLSPHVHNDNFAREGLDAVYVPLLVAPGYESFKAFMETFTREPSLDLRGLSVTLPHKENAYRYVKEKGGVLDAVAEGAGAVNTLRIERREIEPREIESRGGSDVALFGTSTDHPAMAACLSGGLEAAGRSAELRGVRVAVLGAGGTGRTVTAMLSSLGAEVAVYNRTVERAQELAREFANVTPLPLSELPAARADVFVNTTTQGMYPNGTVSAWGDTLPKLGPPTVVFDTVYTPLETVFLRQAREAGAVTVSGVEMFARQAAEQYQFWTGRPGDVERFRTRAEEELRRRGVG